LATTSSTITTDYVDLLLSADGDLILTDGDLTLATDNSHSLVQRLRMRLNIWQTEWIYNQSFGMPYLIAFLNAELNYDYYLLLMLNHHR
jgi:hypothetical protein